MYGDCGRNWIFDAIVYSCVKIVISFKKNRLAVMTPLIITLVVLCLAVLADREVMVENLHGNQNSTRTFW